MTVLRLVPQSTLPNLEDLPLNLTRLAVQVTMAATLDSTLPGENEIVSTTLGVWEALTGLSRDEAVEFAHKITLRADTTYAYAVDPADTPPNPCDRSN